MASFKRLQSWTFLEASLCLLALCCVVGTYYSFTLVWANTEEPLPEGKRMRHVYTARDVTQVLLVTTENRLGGALTAINSIVRNADGPVHFFLVTDNSSIGHLWSWIENSHLKSVSYEIKAFPKEWLAGKLPPDGMSDPREDWLSYSKAFIARLFPSMKGRLVCLDDDVIVQGAISELAAVNISPGHVGAFSQDCDAISRRLNPLGNKYGNLVNLRSPHIKYLNINGSTCIFNIGVFVLNVTAWRTGKIENQIERWMELNIKEKIYRSDGPLAPMLLALYRKVSLLDPRWHVRHLGIASSSRYSHEFLQKAKLLHWDGHFKPWGHRAPHVDLWDKYYVKDPMGKFHPVRKYSLQ